MHAIRVEHPGGPDVLRPVELDDPRPSEGEVLVAVEAAGVNFIDVYRRTGLYPVPLPSTPGAELAGRVIAVGPGTTGPAVGDRVASADATGAYADLAVVPADRLVPVPDGVDASHAAAVLLQGLTAHYLVTDTFPLRPGHRCVVQAAAGGVGLLLVQLAKQFGAEVFAVVGSADKADLARSAGADHVVVRDRRGFRSPIEELAGPRRIDVVYDGVGRATFTDGLDLLRPRGMMVTYGNASGPVDPFSPLDLARRGSLFVTRPMLMDYVATPDELRSRAADVLDRVARGTLGVHLGATFPLADAAAAHRLLESGTSTGKILLTP